MSERVSSQQPNGLTAAARPMVELAAIAGLVTADLWLVWDRPWLSALARAMAAAVLIASLLRRAAGRRLQPTAMTAARAWLEAAAATLALGVAVVAWAAAVRGPLDEPDLSLLALPAPALGLWLLRRLALVSVQQLALQLCLWPLAREVLGSGARATLLVAVLFGLGHLPSPAFAVATAIGAALWIGLYRRSRRLAPLIASHALLAGLASTLPDRLFYDMKVGAPALEIAAAQQSLAGEDRRSLLAAFGSPRYGAYRGGTDEGYVAGLYRDVLGRVATEEEVRDGVEQLATTTRLGLAKRMLLAPELDDATLWRRVIDDQPLAPGIDVAPASADVVFAGWYPAEGEWRWARDPAPAIGFRIDREPGRGHVLALSGGAAAHAVPEARQRPVSVELELNGRLVGSCRFTDFTPRDYRFVLDPEHLAADGDNLLRFLGQVLGEIGRAHV